MIGPRWSKLPASCCWKTPFFHFSGQLLLKYILKPLISYPCLQPFTEEQSDVFILRFKSEEPNLDHSSPMEVFDKIKLIFQVLHKYLLSR